MSNTISSLTQIWPDSLQQIGESTETSKGFRDELTAAVGEVDKLQNSADLQVNNLLQGKDQDVHSAMIAVEKADIGFQLMMQVRNKIVNAYQEIARMQF